MWAQGLKSLLLVISCVMEMCFYRETTSDCGSDSSRLPQTLPLVSKTIKKLNELLGDFWSGKLWYSFTKWNSEVKVDLA